VKRSPSSKKKTTPPNKKPNNKKLIMINFFLKTFYQVSQIMVFAFLVGCRFLRKYLPVTFTFQNRNREFDPLSVNLGAAATKSRTGDRRRSMKLEGVAILAAVITAVVFLRQWCQTN